METSASAHSSIAPFGDYLVFVDESGDHELTTADGFHGLLLVVEGGGTRRLPGRGAMRLDRNGMAVRNRLQGHGVSP